MLFLAGHIPVWFYKDKEGKYKVKGKEKLVERSEGTLKRMDRLMVFPEGKLSQDGSIGDFKIGFFNTAKNTNAPIVPVAMWGNHTLFPPGSAIAAAHPGRVEITFGNLIHPESFETAEDLRDHVRQVVVDLQKTLPSYVRELEKNQVTHSP